MYCCILMYFRVQYCILSLGISSAIIHFNFVKFMLFVISAKFEPRKILTKSTEVKYIHVYSCTSSFFMKKWEYSSNGHLPHLHLFLIFSLLVSCRTHRNTIEHIWNWSYSESTWNMLHGSSIIHFILYFHHSSIHATSNRKKRSE